MKTTLRVRLDTTPERAAQLAALQAMFAQACNALAPLVQRTRVWNRVALHHMAYKPLRAQFPQLGSQMACNVIYAVSRHSRLAYQGPASPFNIARLGAAPLPLLRFREDCPVYFDRHTLSLRDGTLSLFTLDGRMRFRVALQPAEQARFQRMKLRELVLLRRADGRFELRFEFTEGAGEGSDAGWAAAAALPPYLKVEERSLVRH